MVNKAVKYLDRRSLLQGMKIAATASLVNGFFAGPPLARGESGGDAEISDQNTPKTNAAENPLEIPTWYYQHFDADFSLPVPERGFGGWQKTTLEFSRRRLAVVVMHAWDLGTPGEFPGWWRAVPYAPRSQIILRDVFPPLLRAVRNSEIPVFHVVGGGQKYWKDLPGYQRARSLAGPEPPPPEPIPSDPRRDKLAEFRRRHSFVGAHNQDDVRRGFARLDFASQARPRPDEGVAETTRQLVALCREKGINHLVYTGFALNWCLLLSPGGMAEMHKYSFMCSVLRQATTAVENKETAQRQLCKEIALWRVALAYGFVFDVDDFVKAIKK